LQVFPSFPTRRSSDLIAGPPTWDGGVRTGPSFGYEAGLSGVPYRGRTRAPSSRGGVGVSPLPLVRGFGTWAYPSAPSDSGGGARSEEHTSELQSRENL